jgi:TRAP-type C4-dicarboxylate transport system permease small subunit
MTRPQKQFLEAIGITALILGLAVLLLVGGITSCASKIDFTQPVDVIPQDANPDRQ